MNSASAEELLFSSSRGGSCCEIWKWLHIQLPLFACECGASGYVMTLVNYLSGGPIC